MERVSPLPEETLVSEPDVGFWYLDALHRIGATTRAVSLAAKIEPAVRRTGDRRLVLNFVNVLGVALFESGRSADAEERFGELLDSAVEWGDEEFAARASNNLGILANVRGRRDLALTQYQRALASYQRLGYRRGLAQTHHNLGITYRDLGFDPEADAHFQRAMEIAAAEGDEDVIAMAETERAMLCARCGDGKLAGTLARRALGRFEVLGNPLGRADALRVLAAAAQGDGRVDEAGSLFDEALVIAEEHADALLRAEVQRDRGRLLRDTGRVDEARTALLDAAASFESIGAAAEAAAVRGLLDGLSPS